MSIEKNNLNINLDLREANKQVVKVDLSWRSQSEFLDVILPVWTPGSYMIRDHAQHLYGLSANQDSEELTFSRTGLSSWKIKLRSSNKVTIKYSVICNELTVRTSYIDSEFASICLSSCVLLIKEARNNIHTLKLITPTNWNEYIPLPFNQTFYADNYDQLIDTPVHCGDFIVEKFDVYGLQHKLITIGCIPHPLPSTFLTDISKICKIACDLSRTKPPSNDKYTFVLIFTDKGYGGLEHDNSTVIHFSWSSLDTKEGYRKLLQIIGHEYFHQWNIRRLRPIEYVKYNYTEPILSESLWFAEGVTSYYDLLFPYKSELTGLNELIQDLSTEFKPLFNSEGIYHQSLSNSSIEAWVKLYKSKPQSIHTQVSYYRLGSAVSLCLDILLRSKNSSLAIIFRHLWEKFGNNKSGYCRKDILDFLDLYDIEISKSLVNWLDCPGSLPLAKILKQIGLTLNFNLTGSRDAGLELVVKEEIIKVNRIRPYSSSENAGLIVGDEIISIGEYRIRQIDDLPKFLSDNLNSKVLFSRNGRIKESILKGPFDPLHEPCISINPDATLKEKQLREKWLEII